MPFDFTTWVTGLVGGGIGGLVVATAGSYLKGYSTKKGERLATYEDIRSLLAQERATAYEQEKGRQLATHEDIENVLRELQTVTQTTETIKAEVSTNVWLRQTLWLQRREVYTTVLKKVHQLWDRLNSYRSTRFVALQDAQKGLPNEHVIKLESQAADRFTELSNAQGEFFDALTEAEIFLDGMGDIKNRYVRDAAVGTFWKDHTNADNSWGALLVVSEVAKQIVALARKDLGIGTQT